MKYNKMSTIVLALCISMGIHIEADARLNWYDRVLQPIVSNQVAPAWNAMIVTAQKKLSSAVFQVVQKIAPGVASSTGAAGRDIEKGGTVIESEDSLNVALNELFKQNMAKPSTIETVQPGSFDYAKNVLNANKMDREEAENKKETLIGINKGTYNDGKGTYENILYSSLQNDSGGSKTGSATDSEGNKGYSSYQQIINKDGSLSKVDKIQANTVTIRYNTPIKDSVAVDKNRTPDAIGISTPSGQALLHPEVYSETLSALRNYQFKVLNEKMEDNKDALKRIAVLMEKIEDMGKAGLPNSSEQTDNARLVAALTAEIADETLKLNNTNKDKEQIDSRYEKADAECQKKMDEYTGILGDHVKELAVLTDEEEWLDDYIAENGWRWNDDSYYDVVPKSVLEARLNTVKVSLANGEGKNTQALQDEITWLENQINPPNQHVEQYWYDDDYGYYSYGYYDEDGYFHYYGTTLSELNQRLASVRSTIGTEQNIIKQYCDKFEQAYQEYETRMQTYAHQGQRVNEERSLIKDRLTALAVSLAAANSNLGTTSQQEKERNVVIESLRAELAAELAKLEGGSNRLDQAIEMYDKESKNVEKKKAIAAMSFQGFDPYHLTDSEKAAGMETPEQLDKGYVTRKGNRKL